LALAHYSNVPVAKIDRDLTSIRNSAIVVKHKQFVCRHIFRADQRLHQAYLGEKYDPFVNEGIDKLSNKALRELFWFLNDTGFYDQT